MARRGRLIGCLLGAPISIVFVLPPSFVLRNYAEATVHWRTNLFHPENETLQNRCNLFYIALGC